MNMPTLEQFTAAYLVATRSYLNAINFETAVFEGGDARQIASDLQLEVFNDLCKEVEEISLWGSYDEALELVTDFSIEIEELIENGECAEKSNDLGIIGLDIENWDVDAQQLEPGQFASYILVSFSINGLEVSGSIQEDCGSYVEFIDDSGSDFYALDDDVKDAIFSEAFQDIKAAQKVVKDDDFMENISEHDDFSLINSVSMMIIEKCEAEKIEEITSLKCAKALVEVSEEEFSVCDAMIALQIQFEMSQSDSNIICVKARGY